MKESVCLITGATSGIGRATAYEMAKRKYTVVVAGRNRQKCASTVESIIKVTGNQFVDYLVADLSSQENIHILTQQFQRNHERLDVLVNNVGTIAWTRQLSPDGIDLTFALNHLSYFLVTQLLLDVLKSSAPSRIINVSSIVGKRAIPYMSAYCASKFAMQAFSESLRVETTPHNIRVTVICPPRVQTDFDTTPMMQHQISQRVKLYSKFTLSVS